MRPLSAVFLILFVFCRPSQTNLISTTRPRHTPPHAFTHTELTRLFFFLLSCSEEKGSLAPFAWTFQRLRDFAQSLLEDHGCKTKKTHDIFNLFPLPTRIPPHQAKKQNCKDTRLNTTCGMTPLRN